MRKKRIVIYICKPQMKKKLNKLMTKIKDPFLDIQEKIYIEDLSKVKIVILIQAYLLILLSLLKKLFYQKI